MTAADEDQSMVPEWGDDEFYFLEPDDAAPEELFPAFHGKKTVIVPRLQRMDEYIRIHYRKAITKRVCQWINHGYVYVESEETAKAIPESIFFQDIRFWRENRISLLADVRLTILIDIVLDGEACQVENTYYAEIGFRLDEQTACQERSFYLLDVEPKHPGMWQLSEYLIPRMTKAEVEEKAQEFVYHHLPGARDNQLQNNAFDMAEKLGLKIERHTLWGHRRTRSILFFHQGTIAVKEYRSETDSYVKVNKTIAANTIVLNSDHVKIDTPYLDIYHECVHYEWHYLFYRLQNMHNNDLKQIRRVYRVRYEKKGEKDPLSWLEWQARQGSMSMWMPKAFMKEQIAKLWRTTPPHDHLGARYQIMAWKLAESYLLPKYRVRARLINMGHVEAKGALNYYDGHYIEPFSFSRDHGNGCYSFFITPKAYAKLFVEENAFREIIQTGNFVYVDGHICWNDAAFVEQKKDGPRMTQWAKAHVDECCLRFIEVYEQDEELAYRFGRLNSDDEYNRHYLSFPGCANEGCTPKERLKAMDSYVRELRKYDFPEMLVKLMSDANVTVEQMVDVTGISERTLIRLRKEQRETYSIDQLVGVIVCLHLPPAVSNLLLERAGIHLEGNPQMMIYLMIINLHFMDSLQDVQKRIAEYGHAKLKLKDENDVEVA